MPKAKGHLEPHVSNLPRRKHRNNPVAGTSHRTKSTRSETPQTSTLPTEEPLPLPPSTVITPPLPPPLPTPQSVLQRPSSPSKGPIGPTISNLPRRPKPTMPTDALLAKRRREWEKRTKIQEILPNSGVFLCFRDPDDSDDDLDEFIVARAQHYNSIIRVCAGSDSGIRPNEFSKSLDLVVPKGLCHDHGMPHLSAEQMLVSWKYLTVSSPRTLARQLISTTRDRAVDAVAIAVGYLALKFLSQRPAESDTPPPGGGRCAARQCFCFCDHSVHGQDQPIHTILAHINDFHEDTVDGAWQGVLSRDGIDWLEQVVERSREVECSS